MENEILYIIIDNVEIENIMKKIIICLGFKKSDIAGNVGILHHIVM